MKKFPHTLLLIILAGLAFNAHALCVNQDGTLDDGLEGSNQYAQNPCCRR